MDDNTAQSVPSKKSPPSDDFSDEGLFDISETPKARHPVETTTRASKKLKAEASLKNETKVKVHSRVKSNVKVIDLTGKKSKPLKIQGPLSLETVQEQFKES